MITSHYSPHAFSLPDRSGKRLRWLASVAGVVTVLLALAPIGMIAMSWGSDQTDVWRHLIDTQLLTLLRNTVVLLLGVAVGVILLGVSLAWLTVMYDFPGRKWFDWALMLPMAMPAYVLAFVVLGIFDFAGPLQQGLHSWFGNRYTFLDVRHEAVVIAVLVLVFYPYVYLLARSAFLAQGGDVMEAARILGAGRWAAFFRVALPMARPAIIAGTSLALMETLADFGTVAVFNYDTFTTAIYKAWFGLFNLQAAAQLASLLLLFVAIAILAEKTSRGDRSYIQSARKQHRSRRLLTGKGAWLASSYCLVIVCIGFLLPLLQLFDWVLDAGLNAIDRHFIQLLWRTVLLGVLAALITVSLAMLLALCRRQAATRLKSFYDLATLGYALPGSVLAVGVMLVFSYVDKKLIIPLLDYLELPTTSLLVGSVLALLTAYWVRFLAVASGPVESSLQRIRPSIPEAAQTLGISGWSQIWQVYLPMIRPGLLTALVLVFVDVMKEMPATLLLRPFGWDTLAVRIYEMTSEGEWQRAALPAITLVLVGLLPVVHALRQSTRH